MEILKALTSKGIDHSIIITYVRSESFDRKERVFELLIKQKDRVEAKKLLNQKSRSKVPFVVVQENRNYLSRQLHFNDEGHFRENLESYKMVINSKDGRVYEHIKNEETWKARKN